MVAEFWVALLSFVQDLNSREQTSIQVCSYKKRKSRSVCAFNLRGQRWHQGGPRPLPLPPARKNCFTKFRAASRLAEDACTSEPFHDCTADPKRTRSKWSPGRRSPRILWSASLVCKHRIVSRGTGPQDSAFCNLQMPSSKTHRVRGMGQTSRRGKKAGDDRRGASC